VLALTPAAIDIDSGVACILTLKRRKRVVRQVPLPPNLLTTVALELHDSVALCEGCRGGGRYHRDARNAQGIAARLRRQRFPVKRAAASCSTLARPRLIAHDGDLCRRRRARGTLFCQKDVVTLSAYSGIRDPGSGAELTIRFGKSNNRTHFGGIPSTTLEGGCHRENNFQSITFPYRRRGLSTSLRSCVCAASRPPTKWYVST